MLKHTQTAALAAAFLMAFSAPAMADNDEYYYQQNSSQFISYEQAAQAAQARVKGGRVQDVEFEHGYRGAYFEVEVLGAGGEYDVVVDAKSGKVLSVRRDS